MQLMSSTMCLVPCVGLATASTVVPDPHAADCSTRTVNQLASTHTHSRGTTGTPFRSTLEKELMGGVEVLGNMLTVSAMLEYQHKSHEELRSVVRISVTGTWLFFPYSCALEPNCKFHGYDMFTLLCLSVWVKLGQHHMSWVFHFLVN